jgi:hypothetical protein
MKTLLLFITAFFILSGCAGRMNYKMLDRHMREDRCDLAAVYVNEHEKDYGSNQELLFLLDSAMIHMRCGNYEKSNEYFHRAEYLTDYLWTRSFTKETLSFLVNDYTIPYAGEEFEKALINLFSAMNYVKLEQYDEALVEIRRLDLHLRELNDKYDKDNVYKEDAFARYLSGILYETENALDDAFIDYYDAFEIFKDYEKNYGTPVPRILVEDLFRIAEAAGRNDEVQFIHDEFSDVQWVSQNETAELGKIIFIYFNGRSPVKKNAKLSVPYDSGIVTIAMPRYDVDPPLCRSIRLFAESGHETAEAETELVEDINKIALKNLQDRKTRVIAKAAARAAAKQASIQQLTKDENLRMLLNLVFGWLEQADTRTWRTLPGEIYLGRLFVPEGKYFLYVNQCGEGKQLKEYVNVKAGETKFVLYESMD